MGAGCFVVPIIGIVENIAIGKAFGNVLKCSYIT